MRQADRPLTPGWVAGSVRARHMLARRVGRGPAFALAASPSLDAALAMLSGSAYGRFVRPDMDLAAAQRAVAETVLWNVRVISGWTPPGALEPVRALAAISAMTTAYQTPICSTPPPWSGRPAFQ